MPFIVEFCAWSYEKIKTFCCYDPNVLITVASTENLLSRPVREVLEAGIHEKMYRQKQLFNRHGYNIAIFKDGTVKGVRESFHSNAVLELSTVSLGEVKILGLESNCYLAMNDEGQLYGEEDSSKENTIFIEKIHRNYLIYMSKRFAHLGWYVAIKKNGQAKNGRLTFYPWGQKSIQFVARKPFPTPHPHRLLQNRHGMTLVITQDGTVKGERDDSNLNDVNKNGVMQFIPADLQGAYKIRSASTGFYLAMDSKGRVYAEEDSNHEGTIFAEHVEGQNYVVYLSVRYAHLGWYIGLSKSGKVKNGQKTWHPTKKKSIQFIRKLAFNPGSSSDMIKKFEPILPPLKYIDEEEKDVKKLSTVKLC